MQKFIIAQKKGLIIGLNGKWGSGKTYFLRRFCQSYKDGEERKGVCAYLNAWECDYINNPLLYIAHGLNQLAAENPEIAIVDNESWNLCKKNFRTLAFAAIRGVLSQKTYGISDAIFDAAKECSTECDKHSENLYEEQTKAVSDIKDYLTKLGQKVHANTGKPLLLIIDELDRCRPTYAVEMLERIKHLFSIDNIVFLLGVDNEQLGRSLQALYGAIDTDLYLQRFIQYQFRLKPLSINSYIEQYFENAGLDGHLTWKGITGEESKTPQYQILCYLVKLHHFTPRQINRVLAYYQMVQVLDMQHRFVYVIFAIVSVLKVLDEAFLNDIFEHGKSSIWVVNRILRRELMSVPSEMDDIHKCFVHLYDAAQQENNMLVDVQREKLRTMLSEGGAHKAINRIGPYLAESLDRILLIWSSEAVKFSNKGGVFRLCYDCLNFRV